jgi:hypothetical protein
LAFLLASAPVAAGAEPVAPAPAPVRADAAAGASAPAFAPAAAKAGLRAGAVLPAGFPFVAVVTPIDRHTAAWMTGLSWKPGCPVPLADLRVVYQTYRGFDGRVHVGRMVVHHDVAASVVRAMGAAYRARFPIRRMELVDAYGADDDASMAADNTSAFNCRAKTGLPGQWSVHSYGRAIDVNTVENPYVKGTLVLPPAGAAYLDRTDVRPGMITAGDAVYRAFTAEGFDWGGDWQSLKDYQHFELVPEG